MNSTLETSHAKQHPDTVQDMYCTKCELVICNKCALVSHGGHGHKVMSYSTLKTLNPLPPTLNPKSESQESDAVTQVVTQVMATRLQYPNP